MSTILNERLRFEVIKRIAPGIQHKARGSIYPIGMLAQLLSKKIEAGQTDSEFLLNCLQEIRGAVKGLTISVDGIFTWLNPSEHMKVPLENVVEECLELLKLEINQSNVVFVNNIKSTDLVKASATRCLLAACILTYIDTQKKASEVIISSKFESSNITIELAINELKDKPNKEFIPATVFTDWSALNSLCTESRIIKLPDRVFISSIT